MQTRELTDISQLDEIVKISQQSENQGVLIFKHSTSCAISQMAWRRFQNGWQASDEEIPVYYLDLKKHRDVSNAVAEKFGVRHESPQVLLIRDGKCEYDASHNGIRPEWILEEA